MLHFFFFLMIRPPPRPPLFPYTPLSRSQEAARFGMSLAQIGLAPSWFLAKKLLEVAGPVTTRRILRSEEHTSELQSQSNLVCRLLLEKKTISEASLARTSCTTTISPPHP